MSGEKVDVSEKNKKGKLWLWILGWVCIFPVPLTILLFRKKDMNKFVKGGLTAAAWAIYLITHISPLSPRNDSEGAG